MRVDVKAPAAVCQRRRGPALVNAGALDGSESTTRHSRLQLPSMTAGLRPAKQMAIGGRVPGVLDDA